MLTSSDQLRVVAFLKRFGCNRNESLTYLEALTSGTSSIVELAQRLKQNRISVYYSVHQLIEKGFLFEIRKGKKRFIVAENPEILMRIIGQRHSELESLETDVSYISKLLNSIPLIKHEMTVVRLYEDVEGYKKMLEESLKAKKEILIFSNTTIFSAMLGEEYKKKYYLRKAALGINSRVIYTPSPHADMINANQDQYKIELRLLSDQYGSEGGFYIWDNTVSIQSLKENKTSCTIIENRDIANFFRENIFNHFWKEAKPAGTEQA